MALLTNINGKFSVSDAGAVTFNDAFTFPTADGTANYVLKTNGSGQLAWAADNDTDYDYWILQGDSSANVNINSTNILKFVGGTYMDANATWAGGSYPRKLTINHENTSRSDTTSTDAPAFGGTFEAVTSVTTNATGHVTAIDVSTVTIPSENGDITGSGTANTVTKFTGAKVIGDGPITFSSNDSTFSGAISAAGTITCNNVGSDKKIAFRRTGGNNFSIEHDSAFIYFYNETTSNVIFKMANNNDVTFTGNVILGTGDSLYAGSLRLLHDGSNALFINQTTGDIKIQNSASDKDIIFKGLDGASSIDALTLDMSNGGSATFRDDIDYGGKLTQTGSGTNRFSNAQITTQFDTSSFLRLHPSATTDSGGYTNMIFGTSTVNNYGVAIGGLRAGTDGEPSFSMRMLNDSITGTEVLNISNSGAATFAGSVTVNTPNSNIFTLNRSTSAGGYMVFRNNNADKLYIGSRGTVSGNGGTGYDFYTVGGNDMRFFAGTLKTLTLDTSANATFSGNVAVIGSAKFIEIGSANTGTNFGFIGWNAASKYLFIGNSYNSAYNENIIIDSAGKVGIGENAPGTLLSLKSPLANTSIITLKCSKNDSSWTIGDRIGGVNFFGEDGSGQGAGIKGSINYIVTSTSGGSNAMTFNVAGTSNNMERMRIDNSGNVGIGNEGTSIVVTGKGLGIQNIGQDTTASMRLTGHNATGDPGVATYTELKHYGEHLRFGINHNGGTDAITIDSSKNVGIGTTSPNQDGFGASTKVLSLKGNSSGGEAVLELIGLGNADNDQVGVVNFMSQAATSPLAAIKGLRHTSDESGKLTFLTAGSERMRIDATGKVGIGVTNPTYKLHVASSNNVSIFEDTSNANGAAFIVFNRPSVFSMGSITRNGSANSVSYNTGSDYRLKEDLKDFNALDLVNNITAYDYKWKDVEQRDYGFIAHELKQTLPNVVTGEKDGEKMQGVDYSKLTPILLKALQEQQEIINDLKSRIEQLEN